MCPMHNAEVFGLVLGIIGAGLLSEDGATVTAATLAATCLLDIRLAFVSAFCGLWIGDLAKGWCKTDVLNLAYGGPEFRWKVLG